MGQGTIQCPGCGAEILVRDDEWDVEVTCIHCERSMMPAGLLFASLSTLVRLSDSLRHSVAGAVLCGWLAWVAWAGCWGGWIWPVRLLCWIPLVMFGLGGICAAAAAAISAFRLIPRYKWWVTFPIPAVAAMLLCDLGTGFWLFAAVYTVLSAGIAVLWTEAIVIGLPLRRHGWGWRVVGTEMACRGLATAAVIGGAVLIGRAWGVLHGLYSLFFLNATPCVAAVASFWWGTWWHPAIVGMWLCLISLRLRLIEVGMRKFMDSFHNTGAGLAI